jgi:hypothetical protein
MEGDNDNFDLFDFWFDIMNIGGANIKFEKRCQLNKKITNIPSHLFEGPKVGQLHLAHRHCCTRWSVDKTILGSKND